MRAMKKLSCVLLAVLLVLSLTVTAFAAEALTDGQITVTDTIGGQTYDLYRLFDFEPVADRNTEGSVTDGGTVAQGLYTVADGWEGFLVSGEGHQYFTWLKDAEGNDTKQITGINEGLLGDAGSVQLFAQKALAWAKANKVAAFKTAVAEGTVDKGTDVVFDGLPYGYYLIDSSTGALVSLDTAGPSVTMKEKNEVPSNKKEVIEDSTVTAGPDSDADVGQEFEYRSVIKVEKGAVNYTFKDKMTHQDLVGSVTVYMVNGTDDAPNYGQMDESHIVNDYTYESTGEPGDSSFSFSLDFNDDFIDNLSRRALNGETIYLIVTYMGRINDSAVHHVENDSWLEYGDEAHPSSTPESHTDPYTYDFDVYKYEGTRGADGSDPTSQTKLAGAKFVVYKEIGGVKYYLSYTADKVPVWTAGPAEIDPEGEIPAGVQVFESDENGKVGTTYTNDKGESAVGFPGLDADTYFVEEIEAPAGYNKADEPFKVTITAVLSTDGKRTGSWTVSVDGAEQTGHTVQVPNYTGLELPETGGIGTTIFYAVGGILVAAALVLLITKKRMSKEG